MLATLEAELGFMRNHTYIGLIITILRSSGWLGTDRIIAGTAQLHCTPQHLSVQGDVTRGERDPTIYHPAEYSCCKEPFEAHLVLVECYTE